jgi:hypothetical protein
VTDFVEIRSAVGAVPSSGGCRSEKAIEAVGLRRTFASRALSRGAAKSRKARELISHANTGHSQAARRTGQNDPATAPECPRTDSVCRGAADHQHWRRWMVSSGLSHMVGMKASIASTEGWSRMYSSDERLSAPEMPARGGTIAASRQAFQRKSGWTSCAGVTPTISVKSLIMCA